MGKEISLFNDYHTGENILSNHCGLILKLLYEESPKSFEEIISLLSSQDFVINPSFEQQVRKKKSIPDIVIEQKSFSIYFETKIYDWFKDDQIDNHLKGFHASRDYNILFLLSNFEEDDLLDKYLTQIEHAKLKYGIILCPISFEQLIGVLENVNSSENFQIVLGEFRGFLERNNYLPSWKYLLDVVNCSAKINEVHNYDVYMSPDTGGMYKHQRAKFFGGYKSKNVKYIHEIKAVVVVGKLYKDSFVKWNNIDAAETELIKEAKEKIKRLTHWNDEIKERNIQVFLLENKHEVNFRKISSGGLYGSKKYFKNIAREYNANNSDDLANKLKNKTWV